MGACKSCCGKEEETSQYGDSNDRTNLIDPNNEHIIPRAHSDTVYTNSSENSHKKLEEMSDINKIWQEMATNVIDVGTLSSHGLEQHEYRERLSYYLTKLRSVNISKFQYSLPHQCILVDIPIPEKVLSSDISIPYEEIVTIHSILSEMDNIVKDTKIKSKDDLIVPFRVP